MRPAVRRAALLLLLAQTGGQAAAQAPAGAPAPAPWYGNPFARPGRVAAPPRAAVPAPRAAVRPGVPALAVAMAIAPRDLTVGDQVEVRLTLRLGAAEMAGEPRFPTWGESWGDAEIARHDEPQRAVAPDGTVTYSQRLLLAAFRPGRVELPPVTVAVPLKAGTVQAATPAGVALTIRSVLPAAPPPGVHAGPSAAPSGEKLAPKPPAPMMPLPIGARFWWTLAVLAGAAAILSGLLWRRHRIAAAAAGSAPAPALEPLAELLAALGRLDEEPSPLAIHTRLSLALRRYLGRTLAFPAPESTTSEIQRQLLARGVSGSLVRPTIELLRGCDLVKFARHEVGQARGRERLEAARRLGREWEQRLRPAVPPGAAAAAPAATSGPRPAPPRREAAG